MGPVSVVVVFPCGDLGSGFRKRREQRLVETLIPEATVETLDETILHRFSRCDVMPVDTCHLIPFEDRHAGQFGSVARREYALLISYGYMRSPQFA
ncbi:hypothetical protein FIV00_25745 [Labrenzia sp. THAF82]|nr:hypothetical protein FIV00_25745 [Labrenzia sp. THAF82]